jgi:hypothetical protein
MFRRFGADLEQEDPMDLSNGLGAFHGSVISRNNDFGLSRIEMRTPIGNNSVGTVRRVASAAVTNDLVVRRLDRKFVHRFKKRIGR